jgi:hypothetical protein
MNARFLFAFGALMLGVAMSPAADDALPGTGFPASHYQLLWTKSPFTVESPGEAPTTTDYSLVGIAQFDGISYASLIDKSNSEHFLLSSDKPARGLSLVSLNHGSKPEDTTAVILKNGQQMTLKLDASAAEGAPPPMAGQPPMPGVAPEPFQMPASGQPLPNGFNGGQVPPPAIIRRTTIHVPPPPNGAPMPLPQAVRPQVDPNDNRQR